MRLVVLVVMLAGCGRLGFDDRAIDGSTAIDGEVIDAPQGVGLSPEFCDDRTVTTLAIGGEDPLAIRAVALSAGYAVAIETTAMEVVLLELDASGALVARHAPFPSGYGPLFGMSALNDRPVVHLQTDSSSYIKFVEPGWEAYATGPSGEPAMIDPAFAQVSPTSGIAMTFTAAIVYIGTVDESDVASVTPIDMPGGAGGSIVPTTGGARVVLEKLVGYCETFFISAQGIVGPRHTFSPCYAPKIAALDDSGLILHRTAALGPFAVHAIPSVASDPGTTFPLPSATYARIAVRDGAYWIAHGSGSYRGFTRVENGVATEHRDAVPSFPFDLTTRDAFWIEDTTVHVSTPCLR